MPNHDEGCALHYNPESGKACDCTIFIPIELARHILAALEYHGHTVAYWRQKHLQNLAMELGKLLPK